MYIPFYEALASPVSANLKVNIVITNAPEIPTQL